MSQQDRSQSRFQQESPNTVTVLDDTTHKLYCGYYCPNCLDKCNGYNNRFDGLHCYICDALMIKALDKNSWANIKDQYLLSPIYGGPGRVLVQQDEFKSRFDCKTCGGKGYTNEVCQYCQGTKFHNSKEENGECPDCTVGTSDARVTYGKTPCPTCSGKGGTIIIPDDAKSDTTMGNIIAISDKGIDCVKVGDKVMYGSYIGTKFEFMGLVLRIVVEKDLFCLVKQLKTNVDVPKESSFAELDNVGVAHE